MTSDHRFPACRLAFPQRQDRTGTLSADVNLAATICGNGIVNCTHFHQGPVTSLHGWRLFRGDVAKRNRRDSSILAISSATVPA